MPRITLVGYRGSGKSSVAACLASLLGCQWQDADAVLEAESGSTIAALIAAQGEVAFRDLESALLPSLLAADTGVLATGGGVVLREENRMLLRLRGRPVVWLAAPALILRQRLAADPTTSSRRPALAGGSVLDEVAQAVMTREPFYSQVADGIIDVSTDHPDHIAERIASWLTALARPRTEDNQPLGVLIP